ncbi:hypothetical protein VPH35_007704 [Triticum aestivum]|uniref:Uncharacterized protein n=1 Tax=Triticum turgidum subsp. durum TaxID=4567 RepID=A0A9R0V5S5_TRITD|nr:unnamed protein product [Triticum turgidum subsp. durum]
MSRQHVKVSLLEIKGGRIREDITIGTRSEHHSPKNNMDVVVKREETRREASDGEWPTAGGGVSMRAGLLLHPPASYLFPVASAMATAESCLSSSPPLPCSFTSTPDSANLRPIWNQAPPTATYTTDRRNARWKGSVVEKQQQWWSRSSRRRRGSMRQERLWGSRGIAARVRAAAGAGVGPRQR